MPGTAATRTGGGRLREVRAVLARLSRTGELPALPGVATAALALARDPDADVEALCGAIQHDVGITARVLRVANSAVYCRRTRCSTLRDAVTTVGFRTMQDVLSAAALRSVVDLNHPAGKALWEHSFAVAVAAEQLVAATGAHRRGVAFLPALFHDVGRIVLLIADPDGYAAVHAGAEGDLRERERAWGGLDHAEAGAAVTAEWGLPADVSAVVRWHHDPKHAKAFEGLTRLVATADALVTRLGIGAGDVVGTVPGGELVPERHEELGPAIRAAIETERALFE